MRLEEVIIENYRGYHGRYRIPINKLTALIGKNDAGKSTILDALAVFFDHRLGKIDPSDVCVYADMEELRIGCVFSDFPKEITLDSSATTTLAEEYLLNDDGNLEIHKVFKIGEKLGKPQIIAVAHHPELKLLSETNSQLKKIASEAKADENVDKRNNVALRKAIWGAQSDLKLSTEEIRLDRGDDAKQIWSQLSKYLPEYALFRADRPSTDEDEEVQDPLKVAIEQAVEEVQAEIEAIKNIVKDRALDVAKRTIKKLEEFDSNLASTLQPTFKTDPKWASLFKLSLTGDNDIPINKRGSGVRRLVLFSFFRAEAERLREQHDKGNIIYAIEEPETAQHPNNQVKVIEALQAIADTEGCQVLLTTHVPALASLLPIDSIRYITHDRDKNKQVLSISDDAQEQEDVLRSVADNLGVVPDNRAKVLVCVEGPHDLQFLRHVNQLLRQEDNDLTNLFESPHVAFVVLGGSTLQEWVNQHFLQNVGLPEVHIYDRDECRPDGSYKYEEACNTVNQRSDNSIGFLTDKREMENYLHIDAINEALSSVVESPLSFDVTDSCDVVGKIKHETGQSRFNRRNIKHWLNDDAASKMTLERLKQRGGYDEIKKWLCAVHHRVAGEF